MLIDTPDKGAEARTLSLFISEESPLTQEIHAYKLRALDGGELPLVTAGSHLTIPVQLIDGRTEAKQYSICSNPNQRDEYQIAVLLDENDASAYIHQHFVVGKELVCSYPQNNFHLHADASPTVLIADGVGIAPMIAIAYTLAARGRRFTLHYAGKSKTDMAFVEELQKNFSRQIHFYFTEENQHLDIMNLLAESPGNAFFYASGPQKMLTDIETSARLLGIPMDRIHQECFVSEKKLQEKAVILELAYTNKLIKADADQPLLAALRDAGVNVQFDCCIGDCGTCALKVLEGEPDHRDHVLSDEQKSQGFMCVCVSRARSDKLVLAL